MALLGSAASCQDGAQSDGDSADQGQVAKALQAQNEAIKGTQSKDSTNNKKHPELSEPHLVLASPAGIKLVSAKEDIDIQALQKSVNLSAKMDITVTGNVITLTAGDKLTINGAGCQTVWGAACIHNQPKARRRR